MEIAPFAIGQFFARQELTPPWQLRDSNCATLSIAELPERASLAPSALGQDRAGPPGVLWPRLPAGPRN